MVGSLETGHRETEADVEHKKENDGQDTNNEQTCAPDIEGQQTAHQSEHQKEEEEKQGLYLVTWNGPADPENPKNWSAKRKWAAVMIVSAFAFIPPVTSSMVAPSLQTIAADFETDNEAKIQLMLSIFLLAYGIGALILGPCSELYGRVRTLQLANLFFFVFNLGCGFSQKTDQMIILRFFAGLGGSASGTVGAGVVGDLFRPEQRGRGIAIYTLAPLLGPALGPIAGGFITENTTWRWSFWVVSIADIVVQLLGLAFFQETYAPRLLQNKARKMRKEKSCESYRTEYDTPERTLVGALERSCKRPVRLRATQIIVQVLALYMACIYGIMYLVLSSFAELWSDRYGQSVGISSLNYISLAVGFTIGSQISAPVQDIVYRRLKRNNNGVGKPEYRAVVMMPASLVTPIGLFIYGWSAQYKTHWIVPNIGTAFITAGTIAVFQGIQTYIIDSYSVYAASAIAATTVLRSFTGMGFPLFAPQMYKTLGYGWGNSLLGFLALGIGLPAPVLLWRFGEYLRAKSPYARPKE